MKLLLTSLAGTATLCAGGFALAQDIPEAIAPPGPMPVLKQDMPPPDTAPPADPAHDASPIPHAAFTDTQVAAFAAAAVAMRAVRADTSLDDAGKRAQAEVIVMENGLDPETYQAIGNAAQEDPALASRIQQAIESMTQEPGD